MIKIGKVGIAGGVCANINSGFGSKKSNTYNN